LNSVGPNHLFLDFVFVLAINSLNGGEQLVEKATKEIDDFAHEKYPFVAVL